MTGTLNMPLTLLKTLFPDIMAAPMPARKLWSTMRLPLNIRFSALLGMDIEAMVRTLEETAAAPQRLGRKAPAQDHREAGRRGDRNAQQI